MKLLIIHYLKLVYLATLLLLTSKSIASSLNDNSSNEKYLELNYDDNDEFFNDQCADEDELSIEIYNEEGNTSMMFSDIYGRNLSCNNSNKSLFFIQNLNTNSELFNYIKQTPSDFALKSNINTFIGYNPSNGSFDCSQQSTNRYTNRFKIKKTSVRLSLNSNETVNGIILYLANKGFIGVNQDGSLRLVTNVDREFNNSYLLADILSDNDLKDIVFMSTFPKSKPQSNINNFISSDFCFNNDCSRIGLRFNNILTFIYNGINTDRFERLINIEGFNDRTVLLRSNGKYYFISPNGYLGYGFDRPNLLCYFTIVLPDNNNPRLFALKGFGDKYLAYDNSGRPSTSNQISDNSTFRTYDRNSVPQEYIASIYYTIDDYTDYVKLNDTILVQNPWENWTIIKSVQNVRVKTGDVIEIRGHNYDNSVDVGTGDLAALIATIYMTRVIDNASKIIITDGRWTCNGRSPPFYQGINRDSYYVQILRKKMENINDEAWWIWAFDRAQYSSCSVVIN